MKPEGKRHKTIPVQLGGQFSAGDPSMLPDGLVSLLRNYVIRPLRFDGRPPFVYDALDDVGGFAIWQDLANELQKTVAMKSGDNKLYTKNANGIGYTAGVAGLTASSRLTSYTNFLGKLWMAFDNGAGVPTSMAVWDGTTISVAPFNSTINARTITAFINRNFLTDPRVTVTPLNDTSALTPAVTAYDWSGAFQPPWNPTNLNINMLAIGSGINVCRLSPTSTAASGCSVFYCTTAPFFGAFGVAASTTDQFYTWLFQSRGVDKFYDVPITLEWVIKQARRQIAYAVGDIVTPNTLAGNGFRYRCTVAGTGAAGDPVWPTTLGATVADNTVTWINDGADILAAYEDVISNITADPNYRSRYLTCSVPARTNQISVTPRLKFYNTANPALTTLAPIDISFKDGKADTDPAKKNYGQQWTAGDFYYPFFNKETALTATVNMNVVIWSEIENPKQILARNTYPLSEIAGLSTAAIVSNGRYVVFKRQGMWIFKGNADPYEPILPETDAIPVGCLGPRALDNARDNTLYWIGENHVYKMKPGVDAGPTEIDSPGMFEEIFLSGSTWVESQSTYNMPLLAIDHANKDVWIYAQKGKIHVYSIQSGLWSYLDTNPTGASAEVRAMIYDPVSRRMLVSFGGGAATRFDETSDAKDTINTGGDTPLDILNQVVPKPFELFAARYQATLLEVGLFHLATIQNGSLTIEYSYDRGATWATPPGYPVTSWLANPRIRLPLSATNVSVTIRLSRTGAGSRRNWAISKADALLRVHRGEKPDVNAT